MHNSLQLTSARVQRLAFNVERMQSLNRRRTRTLALWPNEYLFLFSHMRSYSTVLSHVLGSHAEISGYGETHLKYRRSSDLRRLRWRIARTTNSWPQGRYLLDKLLHNFMLVPKQLRQSPRLRSLIFMRRPEPTLRSILRMGSSHPERSWYSSPTRAAEYYCERVAWLTAIGVQLKERALLFPAEAITAEPESLLTRVTRHLDLSTPLHTSYRLHRFSGLAGYGDASARLKAGVIIRDAQISEEPVLRIDASLLERCNDIYEAAWATLTQWCPSHGVMQEAARGTPARSRVA